MKKVSVVAALAVLALSACKESFKKGEKGLEYKIITSGSGDKVKMGEFMNLEIGQFYNNGKTDSLLSDTRTSPQGALIQALDTMSIPAEFANVLKQMRKGDSAVIRILTDSIIKGAPEGAVPAAFKKGHYLLTTLKLVDIYKTPAAADSGRMKAMELAQVRMKAAEAEVLKKDDKTITDLLKKNNVKAVKSPLGTYVEIIQPGTGPNADTSSIVKVNYTGKTLDGKIFDSNMQPGFFRQSPLFANLTADPTLGRVVPGWEDGLKMINKGTKAKFYIPSSLAYGAQGRGENIPPNSILVFDIELLDILDVNAGRVAIEADRKVMEAQQKRMMDSMQRAQPQQGNMPQQR